ncbi:MAG: signal peptide peptidase SppA [Phycisphaerales bacterium]|nr:MAG: signal peptide peptidase SppA [Phycisphaerales bacterium]
MIWLTLGTTEENTVAASVLRAERGCRPCAASRGGYHHATPPAIAGINADARRPGGHHAQRSRGDDSHMTTPITRLHSLVLAAVMAFAASGVASAQRTVGWVELEGALAHKPSPLAWLAGPNVKPTMRDVIDGLRRIERSAEVDAIVLRLREPKLTMAQVEELGAAITRVRNAGKPVHVFTEIYGPGELLLGTYADEIVMQAGGAVTLPGIYMEEMFLADTLAWAGMKADFVQVGDYKGANEALVNSAPSKAWEENISGLLDSMYATMRQRLREGRRMSDAALDTAMQAAWYANGADAIRVGLIDREMDRLDLDIHLANLYGADHQHATDLIRPSGAGKAVNMNNPFAILEMLSAPQRRTLNRDTIAVVHIDGAIMDGESSPGGFMGGETVGSLTIRKALLEIERDPNVKGVVVRIDSPGGSAIASESIWLGVRRVAEIKPVWVSVGGMAASGGYYIAVAGDKVYVNPSSIVGSIGVVGGKITLGGLYDKLRVNVVPRARGPRASLMSTSSVWSDSEREFVRQRMTQTYDLFVQRVRSGRSEIDIGRVAEGRLFTGHDAVALRMADEIGTTDDAIRALASSLGLRDGAYDVADFPGPKSLDEFFEDLMKRFGGFGAQAQAEGGSLLAREFGAALREMVGPRAWPALQDTINATMQMRDEPVLLVSPRALIFR